MSRTTLASLAPGAKARIQDVDASDPGFTGRLFDLGVLPGAEVAVVRHAPLGDPIELLVRGSHFTIRKREAERIRVERL